MTGFANIGSNCDSSGVNLPASSHSVVNKVHFSTLSEWILSLRCFKLLQQIRNHKLPLKIQADQALVYAWLLTRLLAECPLI